MTGPVCTIVDLSARLPRRKLETMVNEADKLDLVDPERLRQALYHRTPAQQARDRLRDQAHLAAGLRPLRFTHGQVKFEPASVHAVLAAVVP